MSKLLVIVSILLFVTGCKPYKTVAPEAGLPSESGIDYCAEVNTDGACTRFAVGSDIKRDPDYEKAWHECDYEVSLAVAGNPDLVDKTSARIDLFPKCLKQKGYKPSYKPPST